MELASCYPFGTSNFKVTHSFQENLWNGNLLNKLVKLVCNESCKPEHCCSHAEGEGDFNCHCTKITVVTGQITVQCLQNLKVAAVKYKLSWWHNFLIHTVYVLQGVDTDGNICMDLRNFVIGTLNIWRS